MHFVAARQGTSKEDAPSGAPSRIPIGMGMEDSQVVASHRIPVKTNQRSELTGGYLKAIRLKVQGGRRRGGVAEWGEVRINTDTHNIICADENTR